MEVQVDTITEKTLNPPVWSTTMLYSAIDWWQRSGSFNKDLYEKLVETKYQIKIK
jgi:hypothetical protein